MIRKKAYKYSLLLCLFGLSFDSYLDMKKKQLILASLKNDSCIYDLSSEDDIEFLQKIIKGR